MAKSFGDEDRPHRLRAGANVGSLLGWLKSLFAGSTLKAAATGLAIAAAGAAASVPVAGHAQSAPAAGVGVRASAAPTATPSAAAPHARRRVAPRHLARAVHDNYFAPAHEEFQARTAWSLSNAFTSAFKELDAIPQFRATAKLGPFLERTAIA